MITLTKIAKEIWKRTAERKERAKAKRAYEEVAAHCPGNFENLGYTFIRGEIKVSDYFEGDRIKYGEFRMAWEKRYNGKVLSMLLMNSTPFPLPRPIFFPKNIQSCPLLIR
jgi:hypothetical protein